MIWRLSETFQKDIMMETYFKTCAKSSMSIEKFTFWKSNSVQGKETFV